jgi:hypothetical protein
MAINPISAQTSRRSEPRRRFEYVVRIVWVSLCLWLSIFVIGPKLFVIYLYGWAKVRDQHLHILSMPKGHPWPLSNGGFVDHGYFISFLISMACYVSLVFATWPVVRLALPKHRQD